jgi:hypothetical protein
LRGGRGVALALAAVIGLATVASAHRRDEYLQAARLAVEPGRVDLELDLTPGIAVADATIAEIDRDRDQVLSPEERHAYLGRVLDGIVLELDGRPLHLEIIGSTFPSLDAFRRGEGTVRLQSAVVLPRQEEGHHQLSLRHQDPRDGSVYLANALVPASGRVTITAQRRDATQSELTIDYVLQTESAASLPTWLLGGLLGVAVLAALLIRPSVV